MAPPADLREIGLEGFALIDRFYGARRCNANGVSPVRQGRWVVQVPNDEMEEPAAAMNSRDLAARCGVIMVLNYPKGKPHTRLGRPIKPF